MVRHFILLLGFCLFSVAHGANTNEHSDRLLVAGLVFAPYIIKEDSGEVRGIVVDIVREVGRRTGLSVEFSITNWARALQSAKSGDVDALIPTMKSDDRKVFFHYPNQQLLNLDMVLVKQKGREIKFDGSMASLKGYIITRVRKGRVSPAFDQARENGAISVEGRNTHDLSIKGVAYGRVDLAATDRYIAAWSSQKLDIADKIELIKPVLGSVPVYLALSKARISNEQLKSIDNALNEIHSDGTFEKILLHYLGVNSKQFLGIQ